LPIKPKFFLDMKKKKKYGIYLLLIIGVICVFSPYDIGLPLVYVKIIGICLCMFSLYVVSSKLSSKGPSENQNLKF